MGYLICSFYFIALANSSNAFFTQSPLSKEYKDDRNEIHNCKMIDSAFCEKALRLSAFA